MGRGIDRRELLKAVPAAVAAGAVGRSAFGAAPALRATAARPVVVASANGHEFRAGGPRTAVEEAFARLVAGEDPLAAAVAGVARNELDPDDLSVGYGGLPNADGVVQLDAAVMHGGTGRAGAVACLEGVRTPAAVALAVADRTDHHLLVGAGAQAFARQLGFPVEADLNTETSRARWLEWKQRIDPAHWLDPERQAAAAERARREMIAAGRLDPEHAWGTIHLSVLSPAGVLAGVTTTSGLAWKIPGRVGDSPILGAGIYTDGEVASAGSTGRGEANLLGLSSFLLVEEIRRGAHPKDAGIEVLRRIRARTRERRLLTAEGEPDFNVHFYAVDRTGRVAGVSLWQEFAGRPSRFALCDEGGARLLPTEGLLERPAAG
ncbi:MAG TPA: isoaspartyl peptidase/L-asparaginase [Thermoanaerobaculia bacterium]|nr:MAG: N(4)-(Beta-N-acetylglucosaminyl)-L-asparaginase precursor [Acidobacteria bacterium ADurb.Bin051]HQN39353.1 isoaspartyl peptidase/L-asparaginase [Thermoanaerobaculia bacterium]HRR13610.1 isoaspartyl peptidase/L-asparaginase [Thermoanaerobaculia bacterium]HRS36138.1 isoaspartyl peptidase/L-asparaginase [Thermoanaerobaculia bacterium]HRU07959.1 isoaspartyl peptidase/L-asparaginase [Thermoanaerobaculia bacterium]